MLDAFLLPTIYRIGRFFAHFSVAIAYLPFVCCCVIIFVLSSMSHPPQPLDFRWGDKLIHAIAFSGIGFWAWFGEWRRILQKDLAAKEYLKASVIIQQHVAASSEPNPHAYFLQFCQKLPRTIWIYASMWATLYGALDEIHQYFVPNRYADFFDLVADAIGAVYGARLVHVLWLRAAPRMDAQKNVKKTATDGAQSSTKSV